MLSSGVYPQRRSLSFYFKVQCSVHPRHDELVIITLVIAHIRQSVNDATIVARSGVETTSDYNYQLELGRCHHFLDTLRVTIPEYRVEIFFQLFQSSNMIKNSIPNTAVCCLDTPTLIPFGSNYNVYGLFIRKIVPKCP